MASSEESDSPLCPVPTLCLPSPIRLVPRSAGGPPIPTPESDGPRWQVIGTFVVEFQRCEGPAGTLHRTLAHHMEADGSREWSGIVTDALLAWMLERLFRHPGTF